MSIESLERDGGIPFAKTSLPLIPALTTYNMITGFAKDPYDLTRTTGGSSGGEGGLVGSHCSPFGIASDMAGSVRVPSAWCGLAGLCPSRNRVGLGANKGMLL